MRDNIVGTVILVTALIWLPASCVVSIVDRRRRRKSDEQYKWQKSNEYHRYENSRVVYTRVPASSNNLTNKISSHHPMAFH